MHSSENMHSRPHIRHCIDLLRHALMCRPDLTVEVKNEELGGVTGFGTEHECIDWTQLLSWMSQWESSKTDRKEGSPVSEKGFPAANSAAVNET